MLEAGTEIASVSGLNVPVPSGSRLSIDADEVPAGGFPAGSLTVILTLDDGVFVPALTPGTPLSGQSYLYDPLSDAFTLSDTVLTQDRVIRDLYYGAFNRAPDLTELAGARSALSAGFTTGASAFVQAIRDLGHALFVSAEYGERARTDEQFVSDLYYAYLGRAPEAQGLADWLAVLAGGMSRSETDRSFSSSAEFQIVRVPRIYGAASPGLAARSVVALVTGNLANNADQVGVAALGKAFQLLRVETSHAARVRLYSTIAARDADAGRAAGVDPAPGTEHALICDLRLDDATGLAWTLSPAALGFNDEAVVTSDIAYTVRNESGVARGITVNFLRLVLEG